MNKKGFTLIELILYMVLGITCVLASARITVMMRECTVLQANRIRLHAQLLTALQALVRDAHSAACTVQNDTLICHVSGRVITWSTSNGYIVRSINSMRQKIAQGKLMCHMQGNRIVATVSQGETTWSRVVYARSNL